MNAADQAISFARSQIGKPYVSGGIGPNGYDCSGLVQTSYRSAGITLPRITQAMVFSGTGLSKEQLQAGDLVFPDVGHVQLYVGNGQIIEAAHTGTNVRQVNMWGFQYGRRVTAPGLNAVNVMWGDLMPGKNEPRKNDGKPGSGTIYDPRFPSDGLMPNGDRNGKGSPLGLDPALPGVDTIQKIYDMLASFGTVIEFFSSGHNWIRAAEFLGGLLLLFLGIKGLQ